MNSPEVSAQLGSDRTGQFLRVPLSCRQSSEDQRRGGEVHAAATGCAAVPRATVCIHGGTIRPCNATCLPTGTVHCGCCDTCSTYLAWQLP